MKIKFFAVFVLLAATRVWALGDTYIGNSSAPLFMVSLAINSVCALDAEGVKCWGLNDEGQSDVPALKSPTQVSAAGGHTCAIDAEGVKCWGAKLFGYGRIDVPALKLPIQISAGGLHTCAIDAEGVKCWGYNEDGQTDVPALKSPIQVSSGETHTCALDVEGVKCWGVGGSFSTDIPALKSPIQVSAGGDHTCALDAEGVKCWGKNSNGQTDVPTLKSPTQVSAGTSHTCALVADGVKCWGGTEYYRFSPHDLVMDIVLKAVPFLTSARANYMKSIAKLRFEVKSKTYYLKCLLASPAILSMDSSYFTKTFLPLFKKDVESRQKAFGYKGDIREVPDAEEHRKLAIVSIQSALIVSLEFISSEQQTKVQDSLRATGTALAEPMNNQKILDLVKQVDALAAEKQKLKSSSKSAFLVDSLELAANYLREKVK